jgi:hypothetical protein
MSSIIGGSPVPAGLSFRLARAPLSTENPDARQRVAVQNGVGVDVKFIVGNQ